jgi:hypothetical protein
MTNRLYTSKLGETINGLYISSILRFVDNEPLYSCKCMECGSTVPIAHKLFRQGNARCTSSIHGRPDIKPAPSSTAEVHSRSDGWAEHYAEKLKRVEQPKQQPRLDPETEAWLKQKADAKQRRTDAIKAEYRKFYAHAFMNDWDMKKIMSLQDWFNLSDHHRAQVLERHVKEEHK